MSETMRLLEKSSLSSDRPGAAPGAPAPVQVLCGSMLCRLHVWTESEWADLSPGDRPVQFTHVPGLGWVGAIAVRCMN
jgi:hypothetical protein